MVPNIAFYTRFGGCVFHIAAAARVLLPGNTVHFAGTVSRAGSAVMSGGVTTFIREPLDLYYIGDRF